MRPIYLFVILLYLPSLITSQAETTTVHDLIKNDTTVYGGYVEVPEDHNNPSGRKINIAYVVLKSKAQKPGHPLILFTGGPGEITVAGYKNYFNLPMIADRDVIIFDQRGIGFSHGLANMGKEVFKILAKDLKIAEEYDLISQMSIVFRDSISGAGINLKNINTFQNARDVGVLMQHLNFEKYVFFGGSYGTKLARKTMDYFPNMVHASILAAPATWENDFLTFRIRNFKKALALIFDYCEDEDNCNEEYPDLRSDYLHAISSLDKNPIEANINNTPFFINPQDAMYLLRYQLYTQDAQARVPRFIKALKERDIEYINSSQQFVKFIFDAVNFSMNLCVGRYEEYDKNINKENINSFYADTEYFPAPFAFFNAFYLAGAQWHNGKASKEELRFENSEIPTLISVNKYDPVTPPENGYSFMETLSKGRLLVLDEGGHSGGNQCQFDIMNAFLANPEKPLDTSCLKLIKE